MSHFRELETTVVLPWIWAVCGEIDRIYRMLTFLSFGECSYLLETFDEEYKPTRMSRSDLTGVMGRTALMGQELKQPGLNDTTTV